MSLNTILATAPLTATGYHLKATGTALGQSLIWDNGTNVGIGNQGTTYTLDVSGTGRFTSTLLVSGAATFSSSVTSSFGSSGANFNSNAATTGSVNAYRVSNTTGTASFGIDNSVGGDLITGGLPYATLLQSISNTALQLGTNQTARLTITSGGNVGIGTSSPNGPLDIVGTLYGGLYTLSLYDSAAVAANIGGGIYFGGNYTGTTKTGWAGILGRKDNATDGEYGGYMAFYTRTHGVAPAERMRITSGGNVGIGTTGSSTIRLIVAGVDGTSSNFSFVAADNLGNTKFSVRNDGFVNAGTFTYNNAVSGRSMIVESGGGLGYLVSTRESKSNIKSITNIDFISQLNPVQFNYRKKDNLTNEYTDELYDNVTYGFIADEVQKVNKELVFYNEDGTLAGVEYNSMIAILTKAIQEQQAQIQNLQEQINILAK